MRVIHLSCVVPPEVGGIGSVAAREVTGLRARGVDARLIGPEARSKTHIPGVSRSFIETIHPLFRTGNASIFPDLRPRLREADVIHLHYPFYGTAEPLLLAAPSLPPIVVTFHMDATAPGLHGAAFALHRALVQPSLLSRASVILVSSYDYARRSSLGSFFAKHPDHVKELPFGVDTEFFSPGVPTRGRFSLPTDAPVILFVGGLDRAHAFKGLSLLLRAFARLNPQAHLMIVGDGELRSQYEDEARALGVEARVHFLGHVDAESLRDAYRSADVFAFPSTNVAEAFGLVALEAESCGLPVVASDLPGVRTVVRHGETGLLTPPNDLDALSSALSTLLADPVMRQRMGERARQLAMAHFSWERHLDGLEEIYRLCVSPS